MASTLHVVVASTRPARLGAAIAEWATDVATRHGGFNVEKIDLAEFDLPLLDEPHHPRTGKYTKEHTWKWSAKVDEADAFVFVTPEYNHGPPATLINALSYLHREWQYKPVGFVSYGGVSAGVRAVAIIKQIATALKMVPVTEAVSIPFVFQLMAGDEFQPGAGLVEAATAMLDEVCRWTDVLSALRAVQEPAG